MKPNISQLTATVSIDLSLVCSMRIAVNLYVRTEKTLTPNCVLQLTRTIYVILFVFCCI